MVEGKRLKRSNHEEMDRKIAKEERRREKGVEFEPRGDGLRFIGGNFYYLSSHSLRGKSIGGRELTIKISIIHSFLKALLLLQWH